MEHIKEYTNSMSKIYINNSLRQPFCLDAAKTFEMGYKSVTSFEMVEKYIGRD